MFPYMPLGQQDGLPIALSIIGVVLAIALLVGFLFWNQSMRRKADAAHREFSGIRVWTDASKNRRKILFYCLAIMSFITLAVGAIAILLIYNASFEQQRQRLVETASAQARLIEAVARFDRQFSQEVEGGAENATISQIVDAHQHQSGLGQTGEFTMARLEGDDMVFLLERRHEAKNQNLRIPYKGSPLAEPMRRALSGESGTTISTDYRGATVLAAYEPVGVLGLGIVAKIDLAEIRRPFMRSALASLGVAALLILGGGLVLVWVNSPLIKSVEDREHRLNAIVTNAADGIFTLDSEGRILSFNQAAEKIFGYREDEIIGQSVTALVKGIKGNVKSRLAKLKGARQEGVGRRKSGELFPMDVAVNPMDQSESPTWVGITRDITRRKAAEERFRLLFEQSSDAHVIFGEDGILECNPAAVTMLGCEDKQDLLSRHPAEFSPEYQPDGSLSAEKSVEMDALAYEKGFHRFDWVHCKTDGVEFPVEVTLTPVKLHGAQALLVVWHDLTERKQMEEELRRANFLSDIALDLTGCGYWHVDYSDPDYYYQSERAATMLGEPIKPDMRYHLQDEWFARLVEANPETAELTSERYQGAIEGRYENYESTYAYKRPVDQKIIWLHALGKVTRDAEGKIQFMYGAYQDITQRKQAEMAMQQAQQAAEDANRAKSDFLSHMSHELRTPLNGILGYAQILDRDAQVTGSQKGNVKSILNCGEHLLTLINDVLDLSKIEAGRLDIESRPCNLHKLIQGVADIVGQRAHGKGLEFENVVSPEVPLGIVTDAAKLRQILINLAGNAVKFTQQGSVTIRISESPAETLLLEVVDTGVGMSQQELAVIFDAFRQVEAGKDAGGTGLGLSISKRLAEALGGGIGVTSTPGKGSTFAVHIPLVEADDEEITALAGDDSLTEESVRLAPGQQSTILVADDRETNRDVLQSLLTAAGFDVRVAVDGQEALEMLRQQPGTIDMVLMDVRMPRMNGIEALKHIRADENLNPIKVIAVTASVFPEFRNQAIQSGFDDFLGKPFRAGDLMQKLKVHLQLEFESDQPDTVVASTAPHDQHSAELPRLSSDTLNRLKQAVEIKNLTAITSIATELMADASTHALGEQIQQHVSAFDFARLEQLVTAMDES